MYSRTTLYQAIRVFKASKLLRRAIAQCWIEYKYCIRKASRQLDPELQSEAIDMKSTQVCYQLFS